MREAAATLLKKHYAELSMSTSMREAYNSEEEKWDEAKVLRLVQMHSKDGREHVQNLLESKGRVEAIVHIPSKYSSDTMRADMVQLTAQPTEGKVMLKKPPLWIRDY